MQAIEIGVLLGVAIIAGFLVIGFLSDWDFTKIMKGFRHEMLEEKDSMVRMDREGFAAEIGEFARVCIENGNKTGRTVFITGNGTFQKSDLFLTLQELGWCESIQSLANGCGTREDVDMPAITLPKVVRLTCIDGMTQVT